MEIEHSINRMTVESSLIQSTSRLKNRTAYELVPTRKRTRRPTGNAPDAVGPNPNRLKPEPAGTRIRTGLGVLRSLVWGYVKLLGCPRLGDAGNSLAVSGLRDA